MTKYFKLKPRADKEVTEFILSGLRLHIGESMQNYTRQWGYVQGRALRKKLDTKKVNVTCKKTTVA